MKNKQEFIRAGNYWSKKSHSTLRDCGQVGGKFFRMFINNAEAGKTRRRRNKKLPNTYHQTKSHKSTRCIDK